MSLRVAAHGRTADRPFTGDFVYARRGAYVIAVGNFAPDTPDPALTSGYLRKAYSGQK